MSGIDWPGLYRWSIQYSDGTQDKPKLSQEDIEFLQNAIREAFAAAEDPVKTLTQQITIINSQQAGPHDVRNIMAALAVIDRLTEEYPEIARDFERLGAIDPLLSILKSPSDTPVSKKTFEINHGAQVVDVLVKVLSILSFIVQNNIHIQDAIMQKGGIRILSELITSSPSGSLIGLKAFQALSGLLRGYNAAETQFLNSKGLTLVVYGMQSNDMRYQERACLLCHHLLAENVIRFEHLEQSGFFTALEALLLITPDLNNIQYIEIVLKLTVKVLQQFRVVITRVGRIPSIENALIKRRENTIQQREEITKKLNLIKEKKAKNIPCDEDENLENYQYDLEGCEEHLSAINEALALTKIQSIVKNTRAAPEPHHKDHDSPMLSLK